MPCCAGWPDRSAGLLRPEERIRHRGLISCKRYEGRAVIDCRSLVSGAKSMNAVSPSRQARAVTIRARNALCPSCGGPIGTQPCSTMLKRGAVTLAYDPYEVRWRGKLVPLSPTEAHLFATLMRRGRASYEMLDQALFEVGASRDTRSLVLLHIRQKFARIGARCPYERIGVCGIRYSIEPDENALAEVVIGLQEQQDLEFVHP